MCERVALLAQRADETLHISARLVLQSARGAGFDYRLRLQSGVTENILRHFDLIAYSFHVVIHEPRRHTTDSMFGRSVCQLLADQVTHTTCFSCLFIRRVSQSDEAAVFFEECRPVSGVNPSLLLMTRFAPCNRIFALSHHCSERRFSCVPLRAHRGFRGSKRGGSVGWSCAATAGCDCHSKHPAGCAQKKKQSLCQYGSELGSTN